MRKIDIAVLAGATAGLILTGTALAQAPLAPLAGSRGSVSVEALFMWQKASPTPVPVITDDHFGLSTTDILLGGGNMDTNPSPGFRITGAYAIDARWGIEGTGFYVPSRSSSRGVNSSGKVGSIDLLLPYFDVNQNAESFTEISFSPHYAGTAQESLSTRLGGGELNMTWAKPPQGMWRINLLGGFRYLQLRENYTITTTSPYIPPEPADIWVTTDQFNANNRYYGAQIGLRAGYDSGPWVAGFTGKVALGTMQQSVSVNGNLETNDFNDYGATQFFPGAYFTAPSNMGNHSRNVFAVVPEVALSLGYRLTPAATMYVGYTFLYASNVARPGDQVNRNVNPTQTLAYGGEPPAQPVGPAQPTFSFNSSDYWAQSLSIGFAWRF